MGTLKKINKNNVSSSSVWFLLLTGAIATIYFNTKLQDPFNTPKLIIILLSSSWLTGHVVNSYKVDPIKINSKDVRILFICISFIVSMINSLIFTDIFIVGLIGDTQRRNGFLAYFALVIIFLFCTRSINYYFAIRLLKVTIIVGFVLSFYGLMQMSGKDFVAWNNPYNSIITTLGNPNFASAMMAVLSLLSLFCIFIKAISIYYKIIGIITLSMSLIAIISSQSRQGLLAMGFGIVFYLSIYTYLKFRKLRLATLPLFFIITLITILGMLQKGPLAPMLYKDSVSVRGYYWRAGIEMFLHNPLVGVGLDRYGAFFKEYRDVGYPLKYGYEITSSNAHNTIIQLFATGGVFVGLSYISLLFFVLISGIKLIKNTSGDKQKIILALLSSWIAFQAQSIISIDNIGISIWGWILGGSILGLSRISNDGHENDSLLKRDNIKIKQINLFQPFVSTLILVPILIISILIFQFDSNAYKIRALNGNVQNREQILDLANEIISNPIADPYYKFQASLALVDNGYLSESYSHIKKLLKSDPRNLDYLNWVALYEQQQKNIDKAIEARNQISLFDPWNAVNYNELGTLYFEIGNKDEARKMFQKVLDFALNTDQAKLAKLNLDKL